MKKKRVIVAMSGGVDSSVAAAILKKQGYDVVGIFMKLWAEKTDRTDLVRENICCSADAAAAARAVANKLDIPFYVINLEKEFKKAVVDYYIEEYENGRTPNPCVICNRDIKGEILMRKVTEMDADYLATGHYARIKSEIRNPKSEKIQYQLLTAKDQTKDQTYFLWMLTQKQLSKMLFPIGDYTKVDVRQMAKKWQLPTAERRESQGICFIPDRDVSGFLHRHAKRLTEPGPVMDLAGKKLGTHLGLVNYTIGQRERLGLGGPKAYYVVKLKSKENVLVVGDEKDLYSKELIATSLNWISSPANKELVTGNIGAQIRYRHPINSCQLKEKNGDIEVIFDEPQRAITPGQSIVFYQNNKVLGGGIIEKIC
jgi:tRNA-specific 2-thiouridylase